MSNTKSETTNIPETIDRENGIVNSSYFEEIETKANMYDRYEKLTGIKINDVVLDLSCKCQQDLPKDEVKTS